MKITNLLCLNLTVCQVLFFQLIRVKNMVSGGEVYVIGVIFPRAVDWHLQILNGII